MSTQGARIGGLDRAISKAFTAAAKTPTDRYGELARPGGSVFGIFTGNQGRSCIGGGGLPFLRSLSP